MTVGLFSAAWPCDGASRRPLRLVAFRGSVCLRSAPVPTASKRPA